MTIRFIEGSVLIRDGSIATSEDCCCTPSCFPNDCLSNPRANKCQYYCELGNDCREVSSFEINISDVGPALTCVLSLYTSSVQCCYTYDCECDLFNATYIHELNGVCSSINPYISNFTIRSPNYNGLAFSDDCNVPDTNEFGGACPPNTNGRGVKIETAFANQQVSFTTGTITNLIFPNAYTSYGSWYICGDYTITPGHYIIIYVAHTVGPNTDIYYNEKIFLYSFGNGVKRFPGCAEDQHYPSDVFTGGNATLFASRRIRVLNGVPTFYYDCDDWEYTCQISGATVSVEAPTLEACDVVEEAPI